MDMPGKREIQELMEKRVKQDAASHNSAKKQSDNLSGRLSRAQWRHWLKHVLGPGNKVDRCLQQAWGSDKEWDRVDDQQEKLHCYCTDHATIELS